jgi:hypothetical protein
MCGLRVRYARKDGVLTVNQQEYIESKAAQFNWLFGGRRYSTPMSPNFRHGPKPDPVNPVNVTEAREKTGSLLFMTLTRPDLRFLCSKLASVAAAPADSDLDALDRAGRYAYDTRETALRFSARPWTAPDGTVYPPNTLIAFVDAGLAQNEEKRSQTGILLMLNSAVVYSKSGKQSQLADSTGYAETIALREASHLILIYRELVANLGHPQTRPTVVYEDNSAAQRFAEQGFGPRSLHYDIKYLYVHELQKMGVLKVVRMPTKLQLADICTKPCAWSVSSELLPRIFSQRLRFSTNVVHDDR